MNEEVNDAHPYDILIKEAYVVLLFRLYMLLQKHSEIPSENIC